MGDAVFGPLKLIGVLLIKHILIVNDAFNNGTAVVTCELQSEPQFDDDTLALAGEVQVDGG